MRQQVNKTRKRKKLNNVKSKSSVTEHSSKDHGNSNSSRNKRNNNEINQRNMKMKKKKLEYKKESKILQTKKLQTQNNEEISLTNEPENKQENEVHYIKEETTDITEPLVSMIKKEDSEIIYIKCEHQDIDTQTENNTNLRNEKPEEEQKITDPRRDSIDHTHNFQEQARTRQTSSELQQENREHKIKYYNRNKKQPNDRKEKITVTQAVVNDQSKDFQSQTKNDKEISLTNGLEIHKKNQNHKIKKKKTKIQNEKIKHICNLCKQGFKFRCQLKKHNCTAIGDSAQKLNLQSGDKGDVNMKNSNTDKKKMLKRVCSVCHQRFKLKSEIKNHKCTLSSVHNKEEEALNKDGDNQEKNKAKDMTKHKAFCGKCNKSFKFIYQFKEHKCFSLQSFKKFTNFSMKPKPKRLNCIKCNINFVFLYQYKQHIGIFHSSEIHQIIHGHTGYEEATRTESESQFADISKCFICGRSFTSELQYSYHRCTVPHSTETNTNMVNQERNEINSQDKDHYCGICKKFFKFWYEYKHHGCIINDSDIEDDCSSEPNRRYRRNEIQRMSALPNCRQVFDKLSLSQVYQCTICKLFFQEYSHFNYHNDFHFLY